MKKQQRKDEIDRSTDLIHTRLAIPEDILKDSSGIRELKKRLKIKPRLAKGIEAHEVLDTKPSGTDVG